MYDYMPLELFNVDKDTGRVTFKANHMKLESTARLLILATGGVEYMVADQVIPSRDTVTDIRPIGIDDTGRANGSHAAKNGVQAHFLGKGDLTYSGEVSHCRIQYLVFSDGVTLYMKKSGILTDQPPANRKAA